MLKKQALFIMNTLAQHGFEAYFVGGCVRDWMLGRPVHDIDICTNALPEDVMNLFPDHVPTGLKHGTVSVKQGMHLFEVTTYRTESEYEDFRRPTEVQFVTEITGDLARRDFTMNAMAMDTHERLVDPFGGQADVNARFIRAVGDAATRFREDALRLVRAVRFAAQLDFEIESETKAAMEQTAPYLMHIAVERIREELNKCIDSTYPAKGCAYIEATSLFRAYPLLEVLFHGAKEQVWRMEKLGSVQQKWGFLLFASDYTAEQAKEVAILLKMSKRETETLIRFVSVLREIAPRFDEPHEIDWGPLLLRYEWGVCMEIDTLLQAIWRNSWEPRYSQRLIDTYDRLAVKSIKELVITGVDLQKMCKRRAGDWIGRTLLYLLEQTALHGLPNTPDDLFAAAKKEVEADEHQATDSEGM